jgi:sialate O-acetylesterase
MLYSLRALGGLVVLLAAATLTSADIRLPKIFSDRMVLQRGNTVRIWGTADPDEKLEITLGENSAGTTADANGQWSVSVVPPAAGGPYSLEVSGAKSSVVFTDVMVGDVWLCSGESNMHRSVEQSLEFEKREARDAWFLQINEPQIRLFSVPANSVDEPVEDFTEAVAWQECRGETVAGFSATAFFFARALRENGEFGDVPIGLINASCAASPAEAWTSAQALAAADSLQPMLQYWEENPDKRLPSRPSSLFNGMIAPLIPLSLRGVIWYQGEANVGRGQQYRTIFSTLIRDWRSRFALGDIPFYYVQLAPHRYRDRDPRELPELWDAQRAALQLPNTGMSGSSDIGDPDDLHPRNKQIVGERLARLALNQSYGLAAMESSGPLFRELELLESGDRIRLSFSHASGLQARDGSLPGFQISGADGEFRPAEAKIEGDTVIVWSDQVRQPRHVRYLWEDTAEASLFNAAGLPALPFRSDDFELLSRDRHF